MSGDKRVILSGMRPTGRLHLGHLEGALKNYLQMQAEGADCYFMVADIHALSTEYKNPAAISENSRELLLDWLAVGLDPDRATLFVQSEVAEHSELFVILGMLTPLAWTERCPTYKEQQQELADRDLATYGFLGYPVLQAADILLYRATQVPVGQDQLPHVEMTREIARRFNHLYGETLPEPQSVLTASPKVPGLDGRKMSKSYGNAVYLSDGKDALEKKIKQMYTDPQKVHAHTPGKPDQCVVLALYKIYASGQAEAVEKECRGGQRGCMTCKRALLPIVDAILAPIRDQREAWAGQPGRLEQIIQAGNKRAQARARETMQAVHAAMGWEALAPEGRRP
ncbi:tryptophan--tRNA ligase [candidate division FCPU426 bacterium]|nr:tryptophan--tRNA ligase [candidate division FCPU426 bacterium]